MKFTNRCRDDTAPLQSHAYGQITAIAMRSGNIRRMQRAGSTSRGPSRRPLIALFMLLGALGVLAWRYATPLGDPISVDSTHHRIPRRTHRRLPVYRRRLRLHRQPRLVPRRRLVPPRCPHRRSGNFLGAASLPLATRTLTPAGMAASRSPRGRRRTIRRRNITHRRSRRAPAPVGGRTRTT